MGPHVVLAAVLASAAPHATDPGMAGMDMGAHGRGSGELGPHPVTRDASRKAWTPDGSQHDGLQSRAGVWSLMAHAAAPAVYEDQGGPRGHTESFVLSHLVVQAVGPLVGGRLTLKGCSRSPR